jgi:FixJ family two-component response regulator
MAGHPSKLKLAVVDDDLDVRRAMGRFLRSYGHDVQAFDSAEAYLANPYDPDCAILDLELPGLSGLELEQRLRQQGCRVPVVFVSAHDDLVARTRAIQPTAQFLRKPLDEAGLLAAIAHATGTVTA